LKVDQQPDHSVSVQYEFSERKLLQKVSEFSLKQIEVLKLHRQDDQKICGELSDFVLQHCNDVEVLICLLFKRSNSSALIFRFVFARTKPFSFSDFLALLATLSKKAYFWPIVRSSEW
jgi:hypothetical protein